MDLKLLLYTIILAGFLSVQVQARLTSTLTSLFGGMKCR